MKLERTLLALPLAFALAACGSSHTLQPDAGPPPDAGVTPDAGPPEWLTLIRAEFVFRLDAGADGDAGVDVAAAQASHDRLADAGRVQAQAAGDIGHTPFLGRDLLGTTADEFLSVDQWSNSASMVAFYQDPAFAGPFLAQFSGPPDFGQFIRVHWANWGDLHTADPLPEHWIVAVQGTLLSSDVGTSQAAHDALVAQAGGATRLGGDLAHLTWLGLNDSRQYLSFDVWSNDENIVSTYTNPGLQQGFATVFDVTQPISVRVYHSTDWVHW